MSRHKILQKQNNEDLWLHFTNNTFPTSTCIEMFDHPIFRNQLTNRDSPLITPTSTVSFVYCIQKD